MENNYLSKKFWIEASEKYGWNKRMLIFKVPKRTIEAVSPKGLIIYVRKAHVVKRPYRGSATIWKRKWHQFIEYLAKGKSQEEAFNLITHDK